MLCSIRCCTSRICQPVKQQPGKELSSPIVISPATSICVTSHTGYLTATQFLHSCIRNPSPRRPLPLLKLQFSLYIELDQIIGHLRTLTRACSRLSWSLRSRDYGSLSHSTKPPAAFHRSESYELPSPATARQYIGSVVPIALSSGK